MGDPTGFLKVQRKDNLYRPVDLRVMDYAEIEELLPADEPPFAGFPLHGLRCSVLSLGLPSE